MRMIQRMTSSRNSKTLCCCISSLPLDSISKIECIPLWEETHKISQDRVSLDCLIRVSQISSPCKGTQPSKPSRLSSSISSNPSTLFPNPNKMGCLTLDPNRTHINQTRTSDLSLQPKSIMTSTLTGMSWWLSQTSKAHPD